MTQGVGCYEPERNTRQHFSLLSCIGALAALPGSARPGLFPVGKKYSNRDICYKTRQLHSKLGHGRHKLSFSPFRQEPSVCTFTLDPVHRFPFPIPYQKVGNGNFFCINIWKEYFTFKGTSCIHLPIPSPGFKASCQSVSHRQADIFSIISNQLDRSISKVSFPSPK